MHNKYIIPNGQAQFESKVYKHHIRIAPMIKPICKKMSTLITISTLNFTLEHINVHIFHPIINSIAII